MSKVRLANRATRAAAIILAALCLTFTLPSRAQADALDVAVDFFSVALAKQGIYVGETEKSILKSMVRDVEKGTSFPDAMKNAVMAPLLQKLPANVQEIAKCVATGSNVAGCAQAELLRQLPAEARTLAECALKNSTNPGQCLIGKLPAEAQGMANCISAGKPVAECTRDELINRLPPEARGIADCLTRAQNSNDIAACGTGQVQEAIRKLQSSVASANTARDRFFKPQPNVLENVINIVIGIQESDWQKVAENGGAAVAKVVVDVVLDNFPVTKPLMPVLGPLINVMIENRIDLVTDLVAAARAGDAAAITRIIVEAYYAFQLEGMCSLPIIPQAIREAFCGPLAAVIHEVAKAAAGIVNEAIGFIERGVKDPLGIPEEVMKLPVKVGEGIVEWFGQRINDVRNEVAGKKDDCGTAERYYASRFALCLPAAANMKVTDPAAFYLFESALYQQCRDAFSRCFFSGSFASICDPMRRLFNEQATKLDAGLREAAAMYGREVRHFVELHRKDACACGTMKEDFADWGYKMFIGECGAALGRKLPVTAANDTRVEAQEMRGGAFAPNCVPGPGQTPLFGAPRPTESACRAAVSLANFKRDAGDVCGPRGELVYLRDANCRPSAVKTIEQVLPKPIPPDAHLRDNVTISTGPSAAARVLEGVAASCVGGTMVDGLCRCPLGEIGKRFSDRTVCMPGASPSGIGGGGSAPQVVVPTTPTTGVLQPLPNRCTGGRIGTPPNCHCPAGTQWTGRACLQLAVTPPADPCPQGFALHQGRCVQVVTPQPTVFDFGPLFGGGGRRPPNPATTPAPTTPTRPANVGGGTDGTNRPGPAPTPLPQGTGTGAPIPSGFSTGVIKPGGSNAANALRCQAPRQIINGVCACPRGLSGANCDQPYLR
jgi:hypothetical protein